jgi:hypothetical protein
VIWVIFLAKNIHKGTNIIAKQGEEILKFFMTPTIKTNLGVLAQKIQAL